MHAVQALNPSLTRRGVVRLGQLLQISKSPFVPGTQRRRSILRSRCPDNKNGQYIIQCPLINFLIQSRVEFISSFFSPNFPLLESELLVFVIEDFDLDLSLHLAPLLNPVEHSVPERI